MNTKHRVNHLEVGARLEFARKKRQSQGARSRFTRMAVAAAAGMSPSAYTQWTDGTTKSYDADRVMKVAEYLRIRSAWLLWGEGPMEDDEAGKGASELVLSAPAEVVNETLSFMSYQLQKLLSDDPAKLGRYLKMIDDIKRRRSEDETH